MTGQRAMTLVIVLALLSAAAIVTMLPVEGSATDGLLFVVAALPLAAGGWLYWTQRDT
jgi:hypothetical protein